MSYALSYLDKLAQQQNSSAKKREEPVLNNFINPENLNLNDTVDVNKFIDLKEEENLIDSVLFNNTTAYVD